MELSNNQNFINHHYPINCERIELYRDGGNLSYKLFSKNERFFLKKIRPAFFETAKQSLEIHLYLQEKKVSVPSIIMTTSGKPFVQLEEDEGTYLYILYEFIDGNEPKIKEETAAIGKLVGDFHQIMKQYQGTLLERDKGFFITRYLDILKEKDYPRLAEFEAYGNRLWEKVKYAKRGYCHGDLYSGNLHKSLDGVMYILDLDTSCYGFPMFDVTLICNQTDYFNYDKSGYLESKKVLERFLPSYLANYPLEERDIALFETFIAIYHFQLQATIIEVHGMDCVDEAFLDKQLNWLLEWQKQSEEMR